MLKLLVGHDVAVLVLFSPEIQTCGLWESDSAIQVAALMYSGSGRGRTLLVGLTF